MSIPSTEPQYYPMHTVSCISLMYLLIVQQYFPGELFFYIVLLDSFIAVLVMVHQVQLFCLAF